MEITRIYDLLDNYLQLPPKDDALAAKENGKWVKYSVQDFRNKVDQLSSGLILKGIKQGDMIGIIANNRPE